MNGEQVRVSFHVDDLFITSVSDDAINHVVDHFKTAFEGMFDMRGDMHSYLGTTIKVGSGYVEVNMKGYIDKLLIDRAE